MRLQLFLLMLAMGLASACGNSTGQSNHSGSSGEAQQRPDPETRRGKLAYVEEFLGKRPADVTLWQTEPLQAELKALLGNEYAGFLESMQEAMPLGKDRVVYTVGTIPDDAVPGIAYLLIDTENDKLKAYYLYGDHEATFQSPGEDLYVPPAVQERVDSIKGK